jgi:hypothetical protein
MEFQTCKSICGLLECVDCKYSYMATALPYLFTNTRLKKIRNVFLFLWPKSIIAVSFVLFASGFSHAVGFIGYKIALLMGKGESFGHWICKPEKETQLTDW